jgi:hypothetical protein
VGLATRSTLPTPGFGCDDPNGAPGLVKRRWRGPVRLSRSVGVDVFNPVAMRPHVFIPTGRTAKRPACLCPAAAHVPHRRFCGPCGARRGAGSHRPRNSRFRAHSLRGRNEVGRFDVHQDVGEHRTTGHGEHPVVRLLRAHRRAHDEQRRSASMTGRVPRVCENADGAGWVDSAGRWGQTRTRCRSVAGAHSARSVSGVRAFLPAACGTESATGCHRS